MRVSRKSLVFIAFFILLIGGAWMVITNLPDRHRSEPTTASEWTCSMHPQIRLPGPGKCPICDMPLIPVKELQGEQDRLAERSGLVVEQIAHRELFKEVRTVGRIDYNERETAFITARINGRVEKVHADFTGIPVKKNDHLVDIYSPELFVGQSELIRALEAQDAAKKSGGEADGSYVTITLEAARSKLRLLGLLEDQLREIEKSRKIATHLTIYAPIGGTVIEKNVRAGQYLKEGDILYRIAGLDPIWLYLDVYESDLDLVRFGQDVEVTVEAFASEKFRGKVVFVDPFLDDKTRTVRARVNLPNPHKKLKPGMYASATIRVRLLPDGTPEPTGLEGKFVCPMHPEVVQDKKGDCGICGMPLEKVPEQRPGAAPKKTGTAEKGDHAGHDPGAAHKGHEGHEKILPPAHVHPTPKKEEHEAHGEDCPFHPKASAPKKDFKGPPPGSALAIPTSAVLDTGRRKIAYRKTDKGAYELVELTLGPRSNGMDANGRPASYFVVLGGLRAGDEVVVQGAFLLDSQRQIEGMPSLLFPQGSSGANLHSGHGGPPAKSGDGEHKH